MEFIKLIAIFIMGINSGLIIQKCPGSNNVKKTTPKNNVNIPKTMKLSSKLWTTVS